MILYEYLLFLNMLYLFFKIIKIIQYFIIERYESIFLYYYYNI